MIINKLSVINYKNILQAEIACSAKMNCFFGNNGMGKTNLLDAVYYLSFTKSHLHTPDSQIIRDGEDMCIVQGTYLFENRTEDVFCAVRRGHHKVFKRNAKEYSRMSEHIGLLPLVMISPADAELISGGSEERRRFADMFLSQNDARYLNSLVLYNKAVLQRNALLKDKSSDYQTFDILEMQMEQYGQYVYAKRREMLDEITPLFNEYYALVSGQNELAGLKYNSQLADSDFVKSLRDSRAKDLVAGYTTFGTHKDDIEMTLGDKLIRRAGSQGQNKTFLIALKLAQFSLMVVKGMSQPILLLDDIFDKLDAERVERIIGLVSSDRFGQIFITDTNREYLDRIVKNLTHDYSLFRIENGRGL
ncbi:MAG: DNA replication and repair protein RecF [Tannerella sp.]|jgi:DNA replication and repair protein RecF|nr:DNA replication and repair protein RecF [Tannerella sp.]